MPIAMFTHMNTTDGARPLTASERVGVWFFQLASSDVSSPSNMVRRAMARTAGLVVVALCMDAAMSVAKGHSAGRIAFALPGIVVIVAAAFALCRLNDDQLRTWATSKAGDGDCSPGAWRPMQSAARLLLMDPPPDGYVQKPARRPWLNLCQFGVHIGSDELRQVRLALSRSLAVFLIPTAIVTSYVLDRYATETSIPLWAWPLSLVVWVAALPLFLIGTAWAEAQVRSAGCQRVFPEGGDWGLCSRPSGHKGEHACEDLPLRSTEPKWYWRQPREA